MTLIIEHPASQDQCLVLQKHRQLLSSGKSSDIRTVSYELKTHLPCLGRIPLCMIQFALRLDNPHLAPHTVKTGMSDISQYSRLPLCVDKTPLAKNFSRAQAT